MEASPGTPQLAIVAIGATAVGIDVAAVARALPLPAALAPLPRRGGALAGVAECDGAPLPVVDLARWVDVGVAPPHAVRRILVLCDGQRRIGLLVDAIEGFAEAAPGTLARLHHDDDPDEVFRAMATVPARDGMVGVLDAGRLMALAHAWHEGAAEADVAQQQAPAEAAEAAGVVPCAVLRAGQLLLALPATSLAAVEALPALERIGPGTTAFCTWRGRHVPVVDAWGATGQGGTPPARALLAVVEHDGRLLGIAIDAALDMRPLAIPEDASAPCIVYGEAGEELSFVAVPPLFARHPETALSSQRGAPGEAGSEAGQAGNAVALLVFDAGGTLAIAADEVEQVLPFAGGAQAPATMPWQGRAIAVADLRRDRARGQVMIVRRDAMCVACVVEQVRSLVPVGGGRLFSLAQPGRGAATFVDVADGERQASYRIATARELTGGLAA